MVKDQKFFQLFSSRSVLRCRLVTFKNWKRLFSRSIVKRCIQPWRDYDDKMSQDWWTGVNMLLYANNSEGAWHREDNGKNADQKICVFILHISQGFLEGIVNNILPPRYSRSSKNCSLNNKTYEVKLPKAIILCEQDNKFYQPVKIKIIYLKIKIYFPLGNKRQ